MRDKDFLDRKPLRERSNLIRLWFFCVLARRGVLGWAKAFTVYRLLVLLLDAPYPEAVVLVVVELIPTSKMLEPCVSRTVLSGGPVVSGTHWSGYICSIFIQ